MPIELTGSFKVLLGGYLRSGTSLAALSLEAPNALLSPLRSHLDNFAVGC
jgi:hypothetical protein